MVFGEVAARVDRVGEEKERERAAQSRCEWRRRTQTNEQEMSKVGYQSGIRVFRLGVRPCRTYTFGDQLGLVPGTKSKIEDGSDTGTLRPQVVTVADFRKRLRFGPQLVPRFPHSARQSARRQPPWEQSMDG